VQRGQKHKGIETHCAEGERCVRVTESPGRVQVAAKTGEGVSQPRLSRPVENSITAPERSRCVTPGGDRCGSCSYDRGYFVGIPWAAGALGGDETSLNTRYTASGGLSFSTVAGGSGG
jgi:hypothetical protein